MKTGCALAGAALVLLQCAGSHLPSAAANADDPWTIDVQVQPAQAYLLAAPWDGRILQTPVLGQVYDAQPDLPKGNEELLALFKSWETEGDDKAIAITSYPTAVLNNIHKKSARFNKLNWYLYVYGQPPATYEPIEEVWEEHFDDSSKDLVGSLRYRMTNDANHLRALLQELRNNQGELSPALLDAALLYKLSGQPALRSSAELKQFRDAIEKTTIYKLRDVLGLNASTYNVSNGPGDAAELRPNSLSLFRQTSPKFVFELQRTSGMPAREDEFAERLAQYWKQVSDDGLFTIKDIEFLRYLAAHKYKEPNKWKDLVPELIGEATKASDATRRLRRIERLAGSNLASIMDVASPLQAYTAVVPSVAKNMGIELSKDEIDDMVRAAKVAFAYAHEIVPFGIPNSTSDSVSWMVGQAMKSRKVFQGEFIDVLTRTGATEPDPSSDYVLESVKLSFELMKFNNGSAVPLRLIGPNDALYFSEKDDPFADIISQYLQMAAPVIMSVTEGEPSRSVSADQIRSATNQVAILRAGMHSKIRERADSVRKEFEELKAQVEVEFNNLRYGHIVVPETAIVDSVSVSRDDFVRKGDPIAVIHPVFRHTLTGKFGSNAQASRILVVGSRVQWRFYCDGPLATSLEQKKVILARPDRVDILQMLSRIKQTALSNTIFSGYVVSNNEDHGDDAVRISFELPMEVKTLSLHSFEEKEGFAMGERLREIKFDVGPSLGTPPRAMLRLRAGLFDPAEKCTARFVLPEAVKTARSLENEWRSLWGGR